MRYRGYVYDPETSPYYLQSRYYDPNIGRFLNADAFTSTGQGFVGNNMFAYCGNNPVNAIDSSGMLWGWIIAGIVIGAISNGISTAITGGSAAEVLDDALWGGITGGVAVIPGGLGYAATADAFRSTIKAWGDGASFEGGITCGVISASTYFIPGGQTGDFLTDCLVDSTFGLGKNISSAGIQIMITANSSNSENLSLSYISGYYYTRGGGGKENGNLVNYVF